MFDAFHCGNAPVTAAIRYRHAARLIGPHPNMRHFSVQPTVKVAHILVADYTDK